MSKIITLDWIQKYHTKLLTLISGTYAPKSTTYTKEEVDALVTGETPVVDAYTKEEIDTKLGDYDTSEEVDTKLGGYYTKDEMDTTLSSYDTSEEVDTKLEGYYTKEETYDKDEVDALVSGSVSPDVYTKEEVEQIINNLKANMVFIDSDESTDTE